MIYWFIRKLLNRGRLAPELAAGSVCVRCGAEADEQWLPNVCALRGRVEIGWMPICANCDVELNEHTVRFFFKDAMDPHLEAYRAERLSN